MSSLPPATPQPDDAGAPGAAPEIHDPYAALRYRTYRIFTIGWMAAVVGQMITLTAIGWEIYERTHDSLALGYSAGVQVIPLVFLALPAGILADRFDRRKILIVTCIGAALCSMALAAISSYDAPIYWVYLVLLLSSCCLTLGRPSRSAILPHVVPMPVFPNAVTWNTTFFRVAAMTGPAIGGVIISWSVRSAYLVDAACSILYAVLVLTLPHIPIAAQNRSEPAMKLLRRGLSFVWGTKIILATLTLDLFAVLLGGVAYLLPVFATDILHVGAVGFGWLRAAESIGALVMALVLAHLPPMKRAGRTMLVAVAMFGVCTIIFGVSRSFWLSFVMMLLIGAVDNISVVVRHTLVQVLTPDAMRGRISAVNNIFIGASNELGGLESGVTARWMGPVGSAVFGGIGTLLSVLSIAFIWPQVRKFGSLADARPIVLQEEQDPAEPIRTAV